MLISATLSFTWYNYSHILPTFHVRPRGFMDGLINNKFFIFLIKCWCWMNEDWLLKFQTLNQQGTQMESNNQILSRLSMLFFPAVFISNLLILYFNHNFLKIMHKIIRNTISDNFINKLNESRKIQVFWSSVTLFTWPWTSKYCCPDWCLILCKPNPFLSFLANMLGIKFTASFATFSQRLSPPFKETVSTW